MAATSMFAYDAPVMSNMLTSRPRGLRLGSHSATCSTQMNICYVCVCNAHVVLLPSLQMRPSVTKAVTTTGD